MYCALGQTCPKPATIRWLATGEKNINGKTSWMTNTLATLDFWNHSGSWWKYHASGVGIHWTERFQTTIMESAKLEAVRRSCFNCCTYAPSVKVQLSMSNANPWIEQITNGPFCLWMTGVLLFTTKLSNRLVCRQFTCVLSSWKH